MLKFSCQNIIVFIKTPEQNRNIFCVFFSLQTYKLKLINW